MSDLDRDRRRSPRVNTRSMIGYSRRVDQQRFAILGIGTLCDVSRGGIRFIAHEAIPERSRLELELVLDGRPARITEARVLRVRPRPDGSYEVAAQFLRAEHRAHAALSLFVAGRMAGERRSA